MTCLLVLVDDLMWSVRAIVVCPRPSARRPTRCGSSPFGII